MLKPVSPYPLAQYFDDGDGIFVGNTLDDTGRAVECPHAAGDGRYIEPCQEEHADYRYLEMELLHYCMHNRNLLYSRVKASFDTTPGLD